MMKRLIRCETDIEKVEPKTEFMRWLFGYSKVEGSVNVTENGQAVGSKIIKDANLDGTWHITYTDTERLQGEKEQSISWRYILRLSRSKTSNNSHAIQEVSILFTETDEFWFEPNIKGGVTEETTAQIRIKCAGDGWRGAEIKPKLVDATDLSRDDAVLQMTNYLIEAEASFKSSLPKSE